MTNKELKGLFSLDHNIRLYIPSTINTNENAQDLQSIYIKKTLSKFSEWFGGATSFEAMGAWKSRVGLVTEKITICESYATREQIETNMHKVIELGEEIKKEMKQEAVSLEYDNKLYFI